MAPGDQLTVTCETSLSGTIQGNQATITCAAPEQPTASPEPTAGGGPTIAELRGVQEGAALSGRVNIEAVVSGDAILRVEFQLTRDGQQVVQHTEQHAPYFFLGDNNGTPIGWDTTQQPDGAYMLVVTAFNRAKQSSSTMVHFTIANVAPPPSEPTATAEPAPPTAEPTATTEQPTVEPTVQPTAGNETPVAGQPCPAWVHARYVTTGPDGQQYPTWHPPIDPEFGCLFGHEHGADPRTANADASLPAFGYAAVLMGMTEPHEGFKVFVINKGTISEGNPAPADYRIVFHMGTSGVKRYTQEFHSLEYDYVANDGTGRAAHIYGMADTGTAIGSTCDNPRQGGRDFSTIGCNDSYEIWPFGFSIEHPDDPYTDVMHVRLHVSGAAAAFDPVTTRDPADNTRLVYTQDYRNPGSRIDPRSPEADYQGCAREAYGGPNYWHNAGQPTVYYTDPMGHVQPGPGHGLIRQEVSAVNRTSNEAFKYRQDFCGNRIRPPN
jgi:hypothetical protein